MPQGYFCISAVSMYTQDGGFTDAEFENLNIVPHEATAVRQVFTELGLVELVTAPDGELTHEQLRDRLDKWQDEYDPDDPPTEDSTLALYVTGHGFVDREGVWRLVPPDPGRTSPIRWIQPRELLQPVLARKDVAQVLLILDACFAQDGARDALTKSLESAPILGSTADVWVVAAARRSDRAQQMVFVSAFVDALHHHAERELGRAYLDPSAVTDTAAGWLERRGAAQVPWVAAGYRAGGCRVLPNSRWMPPDPPTWIERRWSAPSRGVSVSTEPGWYFTGRGEVLRSLADHLDGEGGQPVLLIGVAGSGKTAVLARLLTTATVGMRHALPTVARREYRPDSDAAISALDVSGLDVTDALAELTRLLGCPVLDVPSMAEPLRLVIDSVDQAVDPAAMISQLVQPLAAVPAVRLVVATRPALVPTFTGFRPVDLPGSEDDVKSYLLKRLMYGAIVAAELGDLARGCAGNFSAAVVAADTLLRKVRAGRSLKDARGEAQRVTHRQLDKLCRATMAQARSEVSPRYVADLVACLSAACCYSPDSWLPTALWAAVTQRLNGLPYTAEDVEACAQSASAFLDSTVGGRAWRPRYGHEPLGNDPTPEQVIHHLLDEIHDQCGQLWTADTGVLAILLGAAAHEDGRFAALLDDAPLLLAAPAPLVTHTLKAVRGRADGRLRIATWAGVPVDGTSDERAFLLRLRAARNGLPRLAASVGEASLPVVWATRTSSLSVQAQVTRMSLAAGPDPVTIVTAHDDGSLRWWDGSDGRELLASPGLGAAVVSLTMVHTVDGLLTVAVTGDRQARRWGPGDEMSTHPLAAATLAAAHASGLVVLVDDRAVRVVDVVSDRPSREYVLPDEVVGADIAGLPGAPVLWLVDRGGRVRRWDLLEDRQPSVVSLGPPPSLLVTSRVGTSSLVIDVHNGLSWAAQNRAAGRI
ncbi:MAG: hypothetical protein WCC47_03975, partial [Pseudonocardiaceae bacterium]